MNVMLLTLRFALLWCYVMAPQTLIQLGRMKQVKANILWISSFEVS